MAYDWPFALYVWLVKNRVRVNQFLGWTQRLQGSLLTSSATMGQLLNLSVLFFLI